MAEYQKVTSGLIKTQNNQKVPKIKIDLAFNASYKYK